MNEIPAISVVIPTYGRPALVLKALQSVLAQAFDGSFDVHVVDDGGQDDTGAALKALDDPRVHYHWINHGGPAAARNHGVGQSRAPLIAFLDSDTLAQPGWLQAGYDALKAQPALLGIEGRVERAQQYPATPFHRSGRKSSLAGAGSPAMSSIRRDGFLALGGFDQRFTEPCREDSEFAFRAEEAGQRMGFAPQALVRHPVREVGPWRQIHHAREGRFEALIERQHPQAYRRHFKWLDGPPDACLLRGPLPGAVVGAFFAAAGGLVPGLGRHRRALCLVPQAPGGLAGPIAALAQREEELLAPYPSALGLGRLGLPALSPGAGQTGTEDRAAGFDTGTVLALIVVAALYLFSRTPFYTQPLIGEEGIFAQILAASPPDPNYLLAARVNGANIYEAPRHPGPSTPSTRGWAGPCAAWGPRRCLRR